MIGAGPLELELAQALARLGVTIEVFEHGEHLAALHDQEVVRNFDRRSRQNFRSIPASSSRRKPSIVSSGYRGRGARRAPNRLKECLSLQADHPSFAI